MTGHAPAGDNKPHPPVRRLPLLGSLVTLGIVVALGLLTFLTWRPGEGSGPPEALPSGAVPEKTAGTPGPAPHRPPTGATAPAVPGRTGAAAGLSSGPAVPQSGSVPQATGSGDGKSEPEEGPGGSGSGGQEAGAGSTPVTAPPSTTPTAGPPPTQPPPLGPGEPTPRTEEARMVELRYAEDGQRSVDIDYWRAQHLGDGDLNATAGGLVTAGGARLAIVRQGRGDWATCGPDRDDWVSEVLYSELAQGTYLCARSSEGRTAYLRIESVPSQTGPSINFYGFTWDDPG